MAAHATSPRSSAASVYTKLHVGLDHALLRLLRGEDAPLSSWKVGSQGRQSPFEAWRAVHGLAAERRETVAGKEARRHAKRKLKKQEEREEAAQTAEPALVFVVKPTLASVSKEEVKREKPPTKEKHKSKLRRTESAPAVMKTLDLSGANLSPVMTYSKAPPSRVSAALDATKPLSGILSGPLISDTLARLRQLPHLEHLEPGSKKYTALAKWLETDDGSNTGMSSKLSSLIHKLQNKGVVASSLGYSNGKSSPSRSLDLGTETLDDRLKRERKLGRKYRRNAVKREKKKQPAVKTEPQWQQRRPKFTGEASPRTKSRIRKLDGFVVAADEVEYEDSGWDQESEAEYESDEDASDSNSDDDNFENEVAGVEDMETVPSKPRVVAPCAGTTRGAGSSRTPTPPGSGKTSPKVSRSAPDATLPAFLSATEQLAIVTAKLRESEQQDAAASVPTYLSYGNQPAPSTTDTIKQEQSTTPVIKIKPIRGNAGSSESNAIVLDDSDEDEDDDDGVTDVVLHPKVPPTPLLPKPPVPNRQAPSPQPKKPAKPPPKPPATTRPPATTKAAGKAKATMTSKKRKVKDESEDDESEAEFIAPNEEDSSTDDEDEMFDLNEEDVYVVECILDVKRGRTLVTNFGRPTKEADLFLVKWEGYDDLTWEPDANIPKRLVDFFNERELYKKTCGYQIDKFTQRKVAKNATTGREEILYLIQWKGMPEAYWEVKATLPAKTHIWLEKTSRASLGKAGVSSPSPRKKSKA